MNPEQMAELSKKLLSEFDSDWSIDKAQEVHDDLRTTAQELLTEAGITKDTYTGDYDELLTELAESVEWVPEHFQLTKSNTEVTK